MRWLLVDLNVTSVTGSSAPDWPLPLTTRDIESLQIYAYCIITAGVILIYDYLITFHNEIDFIWRRRFTGATLLFILNRYATLFKIVIGYATDFRDSKTTCKYGRLWYNVFDILSLFVFGAFTAFRVWAIWGRELRPFLIVLPLTLVTPCLNIYRVSLMSTFVQVAPLQQPFIVCMDATSLPISLDVMFGDIVRGIAIATDSLVVILTWVKTYSIYRAARKVKIYARLAELLLRDGTLYFGTLLVLNIIAMIINHTDAQFNPVNYYNEVINCILISRFMLNLRRLDSNSWSTDGATSGESYDSISTKILGDLAAPLVFNDNERDSTISDDDLTSLEVSVGPLATGLIRDSLSSTTVEHGLEDGWGLQSLETVATPIAEKCTSFDATMPSNGNTGETELVHR